MQRLYDYAAARGVHIEYCDLTHLGRAGDCHPPTKHIRLQRGMLYRKERSVLAHELAHEYYGDTPDMFGRLPRKAETRADKWAAHFLINPSEYRLAEERFGSNTEWIAQELGVLEHLVHAYEKTLTRLDTQSCVPETGCMTSSEIVTIAVIAAVVALLTFVWVADKRRTKRQGGKTAISGIVGTLDEAFHPEAARATEIREIQQELPAEAPAPGDPLVPGGKIIIDISRKPEHPSRTD